MFELSFRAAKVTVAGVVPIGSKSGVGSVSVLAVEFVLVAFLPNPCRANSSQSSFWFAPPKRSRSAARIASRAWSIDGFVGISRYESKTSWIQRRLPGQLCGGSSPFAQAYWRSASSAGKRWSYLAASACRMAKLALLQISPSAWTCGPVRS